MPISTSSFFKAAALAGVVSAYPTPSNDSAACPSFGGNFSINQFQIYPENVDFDVGRCQLYIGQLFNASLGIYDPYTQNYTVVELDGISHNPAFHMSAVVADTTQNTGHVHLLANTANAFPSAGKDVAGTNLLVTWDPATNSVVREVNLTETSQGEYGGYQDIEQDPEGNLFVVGTWPGTILKVDDTEATPWYLPDPIVTTQMGIGGIAAIGWTLLAQGDASGELWRFDMKAETGVPQAIPITSKVGNHTFGPSDAIYLPGKYAGTVLLVAESATGLSVFKSQDTEWNSAEFMGVIARPSSLENGTSVTAAVQIGESVYMNVEQFGDVGLNGLGTAGNRTEFPFFDVTAELEGLLC